MNEKFHTILGEALIEQGVIFIDTDYFKNSSLEEIKSLLKEWYPEKIWVPALEKALSRMIELYNYE